MSKKILIVDDDPSIVLAVQTLLELEGYAVQTASNGTEAESKFADFAPNLVLLDVNMPQKNGFEVARELRKQDTKIIFLTAKGMQEDKREGYATGGDDYIVKPFSNEEILQAIAFQLD